MRDASSFCRSFTHAFVFSRFWGLAKCTLAAILLMVSVVSFRCSFKALTRPHLMLEFPGALVYVPGMSQTLEKRVEELEHRLAELTHEVTARKPRKKDWQKTFGLSKGDDGFKEMVK